MNQYNHFYAVIMAGGGGTRLWPLSRLSHPKQMINLAGDETLFQMAVHRLTGLLPAENILVVTTQEQAEALQKQCPEIPAENFLLEPMPRGTASVVGLGAIGVRQRDSHPEATMAILTADHFIQNIDLFHQLLCAAHAAAQDGSLVTLGITPTQPSTGYGYIQSGEKLGSFEGLDALRAVRFKEKPAEALAQAMLASGDHSWNSGMFIWRTDQILAEIERQMPDLMQGLSRIDENWNTPEKEAVLQSVWKQLRTVTIDYGIMEGARNVIVIPAAGLGWSDVGSWESVYEALASQADANGNLHAAPQNLMLDTHNTMVFSNQAERLIVTIGVDDLAIVDTGDAILVCRRDQAQKVRDVIEQIKQNYPKYR